MGKNNRKRATKSLDRNKYFFIIIVFILFWFFGPPFISLMIKTKPILFADFLGYVNSENADTWIGFYGDIIGGAITLLGVAWTIIDQNKKREEDLKDAFKPILIANDCTYEKIKGIKGVIGTKVFECTLEYKNVGKGVLFNPRVFNIDYLIDNKKIGNMTPSLSVNSVVNVDAVAHNSIMITLDSDDINNIYQSLEGRGNCIPLQIIMYVGGKDMFGRYVATKLDYKVDLTFFSVEEIELPLGGGELTSKVLFSEEEINSVIENADWKYNVHY